MSSVEKIISSVKALIAGGDLSDSVRLRQLHKSCLQEFQELNKNLEQCRTLIKNGSIQNARNFNHSFEPSLTQIAEDLEYFKTSDFFAVCQDYGLEIPVFPDEELLSLLNAPVSSGEKHLHVLLQDYRKIARNGSMKERLVLLRKIVEKLPNSPRWRKDLISTERLRCQEIEYELAQITDNAADEKKLESLLREVLDPEWIQPPAEGVLSEIRKRLLPIQRKKIDEAVESKLQFLQSCWMEQDFERMKKEFEEWKNFCSNPMIQLTTEQQQTIDDITNFLEHNAEAEREEEERQLLIKRIEQKLADNAPFSEITADYNRLQLMDCEIPDTLSELLSSLEEENTRYEHMRNIRRCVFGICGALLLIVIITFAVHYTQYSIAVNRSCSNMQELLNRKKYQEVIRIYQELSRKSPKIAKNQKVIRLFTKADHEKRQLDNILKLKETEFLQCLSNIERLAEKDIFDNSNQLDEDIQKAKEILEQYPQKKESSDKLNFLITKVKQKRTLEKVNRQKAFEKFCDESIRTVASLIEKIPVSEKGDLDKSLEELQSQFVDKIKEHPYIKEDIKARRKNALKEKIKEYEERWKKEKIFRSVNKPLYFDYYLESLKTLNNSDFLSLKMRYQTASDSRRIWNAEYARRSERTPETLDSIIDLKKYKGRFLQDDFERYMYKQIRSSEFSRFFNRLKSQKTVKELIFSDAAGTKYFFYVSGKVRIEKFPKPRKDTHISFVPDIKGNGKSKKLIISYNPENTDAPYTLLSTPSSDLAYVLPKSFCLFQGEAAPPEKIKEWPVHDLLEQCKALSNDGPGLNRNLQDALKFICKKDNIENIYLKELLLIEFLWELYKTSPELYLEIPEAISSLPKFAHKGRNLYSPQSADYAKDKALFEEKWNEEKLARIFAAGKIRGAFICKSHARRLVPAGIVQEIGKNRLKIHLFRGAERPKEGLVLTNTAIYSLPDDIWNGRIPAEKQLKQNLFVGQVIWTFNDGKRSIEFLREWQAKAMKENFELKIRPSNLPENIE